MSSDKKIETRGIKVSLILEILGKPPEHLVETLNKYIEEMGKEKGVKITNKKVNEPKETEKQKGFYSSFAEIEADVEDLYQLSILMFKYMPAHIEIIEPELIALSNNGWNDIFNELTRRLHGYDEVARVLQMQNAQMQQKLKQFEEKK